MMSSVSGTSYAFISNDLRNQTVNSVMTPVPNRDSVTLHVIHTDRDKSDDPHELERPLHGKTGNQKQQLKSKTNSRTVGPAERKLRRPNQSGSRLRNSFSSDAIKLLFLRSQVTGDVDSSSSRESSPSLSMDPELLNLASDTHVPLLHRSRSKSMQRMQSMTRKFESIQRQGGVKLRNGLEYLTSATTPTLSLTQKARQMWFSLERRFSSTQKFPMSGSAENVRMVSKPTPRIMDSDLSKVRMCTPCVTQPVMGCSKLSCGQHHQQSMPMCAKQCRPEFTRNTTSQMCLNCEYSRKLDGQTSAHTMAHQDNYSEEKQPITELQHGPHPRQLYQCQAVSYQHRHDQIPVIVLCPSLSGDDIRAVTLIRTRSGQRFGMRIDSTCDGVYLTTVLPGSPASLAGLHVGDQLYWVNGFSITHWSTEMIMDLVRATPMSLRIIYRPMSSTSSCESRAQELRKVTVKKQDGRVGIKLQQKRGGLFVEVVLPASAAHQAGIRAGDELISINHQAVQTWTQVAASNCLRDLPDGETMILSFRSLIKTKQPQCTPNNEYEQLLPHNGCPEDDEESNSSTCCIHCANCATSQSSRNSTRRSLSPQRPTETETTVDEYDNPSDTSPCEIGENQTQQRLVNSLSDWTISQTYFKSMGSIP